MKTEISNFIFRCFVVWMYVNCGFAIMVICGIDLFNIMIISTILNAVLFCLFIGIHSNTDDSKSIEINANNGLPKYDNPPPPPTKNSVEIPNHKIPIYDVFDYDTAVKECNEYWDNKKSETHNQINP